MYPHIVNTGDCALTVTFGDEISPTINEKVLSLSQQLEIAPIPGVMEVVPTYHALTVYYDPLQIGLDLLTSKLDALMMSVPIQLDTIFRLMEIPVFYGGASGPDLVDLAQNANLSVEAVIDLHCSTEYLVYMLGFSPGFPYLGIVPDTIAIPRLAEPRVHVPAGSVGIAGQQTGIYPQDSPGGWRIIGQTPLQLYNHSRKHPFLLQAGDRVRFRSISMNEFERLQES